MPLPANPPRSHELSPGAHGWPWYAARSAVALFLAALLGLLWVLSRQDAEARRSAVERDALWLGQNVRFAFAKDLEQLGQLGADWEQTGLERFGVRATELIQGSPGLVRIAVVDGTGRLLASVPSPPTSGRPWPAEESRGALARALAEGLTAFGAPYGAGEDRRFDVFVPWFRGGGQSGAVVGTYGLRVTLTGLVPWWLAEKNRVSIVAQGGEVLATRSGARGRGPMASHELALELPENGLVLRLESYSVEPRLLRDALVGAIALLAAVVLWNLWTLRRHVRRRLATEEALRAEHAFRKAMEDSIHTGMRAVDLSGQIVYANPAFCRMVGYSEAEVLGLRPPHPWWPPEERETILRGLREAREHGAPGTGLEMRLTRRDGERFDALVYEAPLIDAAGRQTGWMGSVLDITERKQARERLRQQEERLAATARLVTMGEMATSIAHELNQPLSAIASYTTGSLNLLEAGDPPSAEIKEALRKAAQQAQRAGRIIQRVHDYVRKREPTRGAVRVNAVVEEAVGFAEVEARKRKVRIEAQLAEGDPEIQADPILLQQVLLNLLRNAMDAMAATPPERREIRVSTANGAGQVTVRIADRGCGLAPEVRERVFDPFFTTRAEGMGMGLAICRSIVEFHGGRVWAEENPGGGAVFTFTIPVEGGGR